MMSAGDARVGCDRPSMSSAPAKVEAPCRAEAEAVRDAQTNGCATGVREAKRVLAECQQRFQSITARSSNIPTGEYQDGGRRVPKP